MTTTTPGFDPSILPTHIIGSISEISPIHFGLSGAGVYCVTAERGEYVLRIQSPSASDLAWTQQLVVMRRASDAGVAPAIVHIDQGARAVLAERVKGGPFSQALSDPVQRMAAVAGAVEQLRTIHSLDPSGIQSVDGVSLAREMMSKQLARPGFPLWAREIETRLDEIADVMSRNPKQVVSHNDANPGNILWDGQKAWFVDWEVAALGHPFYDIACLTLFLNMELQPSLGLLAMQEQRELDDNDRLVFTALRRAAALAVGCTLLSLAPELGDGVAGSRDAAPTLGDIYTGMRAGTFNLQTAHGQLAFGSAFLRIATAA